MDDEGLPKTLEVDAEVFGLAMHPSEDLMAIGLVNGDAVLYGYQDLGESFEKKLQLGSHSDACRSVVFSPDGDRAFTCSTDKSVRAVELQKGKAVWGVKAAHDDAVNCLHFCEDEGLLASGDDSGTVRLWDSRQEKPVATLSENEDFVSDLLAHGGLLFSASGDNTLAAYDLKQRKLLQRSMDQEDELLSLAVMKHGRKLVVGTQVGSTNVHV